MTGPPTLSASAMNNLLAIQRAKRNADLTSQRLATGSKVNSALDNPQNFFAARALDDRASDLSRLLDGIGSAIRVVEGAADGVEAVAGLLRLGESYVQSALDKMRAADTDTTEVVPTVDPLSVQILASNPVGYWRLNETSGATATNLGSVGAAANSTYQGGALQNAAALYDDGDVSTSFDGVNDFVAVPNNAQFNTTNHALRTVELVFNADTTAGRQVLYEEGGTTNSFAIYIDNGRLYVTGRDAGAWGPANISTAINAGQTYHVAFTFDSPNSIFRGYVDGVEIGNTPVNAIFPAHTAAIGIGSMRDGTWFHDGAQSGNGRYFNGRISDVAIYNSVLTAQELEDHATSVIGETPPNETDAEFDKIMRQIDELVADAEYRGINLLKSDNLTTYFNENGSSRLKIDGVDFTSRGLGVKRASFLTEEGLEEILQSLRGAINTVRDYGRTLVTDLAILQTREQFTRDTVNVLEDGSSDLTDADLNEEGANLLAYNTGLQLSVTSLTLAPQSRASVTRLFA